MLTHDPVLTGSLVPASSHLGPVLPACAVLERPLGGSCPQSHKRRGPPTAPARALATQEAPGPGRVQEYIPEMEGR